MPKTNKTDALMYMGALAAGVLLIISNKVSAVEASGYIAPFLVIFERGKSTESKD
ncbi:hypothetical protein ACGFY3_45640 [Streptomyces mirabilis]|uniref:hypothetical protein n=1 Tax=Streptomyces mirabilis TaxID=68239 RepID=UPI00371FE9A7